MKRNNAKLFTRFFDIIISLLLLIVFSPIIIIAVFISAFETKDFPIFIQKRGLSLDCKTFNIYKIRTVKIKTHIANDTGQKFLLSPGYKEKVPILCRTMRKYGIDELPQLVNVLKGEMSIVGPRPLDFFDLNCLKKRFPKENKKRSQINSKPGIFGLWQLYGKRKFGAENLLYWDTLYNTKSSFLFDIKIIVQTASFFIRAKIKEDSIFFNQEVIKDHADFNKLIILQEKISFNQGQEI